VNPNDLLAFAERIIAFDPVSLNPSILRRAVSTAYYALFHLLCDAGSKRIGTISDYQSIAARKYEHGQMKKVSDRFAKSSIDDALKKLIGTVPPELISVATVFVDLQNYRHRADYDSSFSGDFELSETKQIVERTKTAFEHWRILEPSPAAEIYLLTMLLDFPRRV
jgi:hypothetical protein